MEKITKDMNITEASKKFPIISLVFRKYGLGCIGCMVANDESLEDGIKSHGLDADAIVKEMNDLLKQAESEK